MDGATLELASNVSGSRSALSAVDERALIRRAQRGDRSAFDELVRLYDRKVFNLALRVVRSPEDAKDLYQEAFLKVYRSLPRFRFESGFSTWLYRVVMNACLDYLRRQKARKEFTASMGTESGEDYFPPVADERPYHDPERVLHAQQLQQRIQAALGRLNPRERMVFELRHYQGLKLRAIGELCETTEETVKNCLFRATRKLRVELEDLV